MITVSRPPTTEYRKADPFGAQRVVLSAEPSTEGLLPQQAERLDPSLPIAADELLIEIESLSVDSSSYRQISAECHADRAAIERHLLELIARRGKLHNPDTDSGGMLVGRVAQVGPEFPVEQKPVKVGDRIATLVSLTLTPLSIRKSRQLHSEQHRLDVEGHAILFASGVFARIPDDFPETVALAAMDVAGVAAHVFKLVQEDQKIVVIGGGGKSGLLCLHQAKRKLGVRTIAVDNDPRALERLSRLPFVDEVVQHDARDAIGLMEKIWTVTKGDMADVVIDVSNVPGTEMGSILAARRKGVVCYFNLATRFTRATLGAEGVGADVDLRMGNGYADGHAEVTLDILRDNSDLRRLFTELYS